MMDLDAYRTALASLPREVRDAEVNAEKTSRTTLRIKDGRLAGGEARTRTRLYVRATAERTGMVYTERLDEEPGEVIRRAAENSRYSSSAAPEPMNGAGTVCFSAPDGGDDLEAAVAFGIEAEGAARKYPSVDRVAECTVALCSRELRTLNSRGLDASCRSRWTQSSLAVAMKGRPAAAGLANMSRSATALMNAEEFAAAAAADGERYDGGGLPPRAFPSGRYDAVLTGRVMRNILMTAWMELSGKAMLAGDSIYSHRPGTLIGSDALSIANAPSHPMLGQAWFVDSEGTVCEKTRLVERGRLNTPLHTLASGAAAGMPSTGSAGRVDRMTGSMPIALTTVPAILFIEPGGDGLDALVSRMGTGFVLTYSLDLFHSVNIASGDFSIPCGGVYYEGGRPVGSVSQMTMAGNIRELFRGIEAVGSDLDFDDFYLESYTIGSPSALVRGLRFGS